MTMNERLIAQTEMNAHLESVYRTGKGIAPDWVYEAARCRRIAEEGVPWLQELLGALEWQGGTIHQAISCVRRLIEAEKDRERKR